MGPSVKRVLPICLNGYAQLNQMAAMPIYVILVYSIEDSRSTKFVQMMTFLRQGQICIPMHLYRENVEKSFFSKCI